MKNDITITAAAIATLISALTSALISLWITKWNKSKNLDDQLDALLKIAIQYPYLESEQFTAQWTPDFDRNDEKFLRYDIYCILLFNFLSRLSAHNKHSHKKVENFIAVRDWIRLHSKYWENPTSKYENVDGYDKKFVEFIKYYLN
jgi:hypothetical protein